MAVRIEHDEESKAFRLFFDNEEAGRLTYREEPEKLVVLHVMVIPRLRGKGLAKELVESFRTYAESRNSPYSSLCSYAGSVLRG